MVLWAFRVGWRQTITTIETLTGGGVGDEHFNDLQLSPTLGHSVSNTINIEHLPHEDNSGNAKHINTWFKFAHMHMHTHARWWDEVRERQGRLRAEAWSARRRSTRQLKQLKALEETRSLACSLSFSLLPGVLIHNAVYYLMFLFLCLLACLSSRPALKKHTYSPRHSIGQLFSKFRVPVCVSEWVSAVCVCLPKHNLWRGR